MRPLLATTRAEIEAYLGELGQDWREDSSNRHLTFTRNRIRHELLPLLEGWNPRLREHMAQMAELARDEEAWWQAELARLAPQMLLPGRPVRGGGRAAGGGLRRPGHRSRAGWLRWLRRCNGGCCAMRPSNLAPRSILPRRKRCDRWRSVAAPGKSWRLPHGLRAERTARELRLAVGPAGTAEEAAAAASSRVQCGHSRRNRRAGLRPSAAHRSFAAPSPSADGPELPGRLLCATGSPATGSGCATRAGRAK